MDLAAGHTVLDPLAGRRPHLDSASPLSAGAKRGLGCAGHPLGVCRSGLLEFPDGRILIPSKATDRPDGSMPCFGMLRVSHDMGETWEYGGRITADPVAHFSEPSIHRTPSGRILVVFRCHANQPLDDSRYQALVISDDDGKTWTP